MLPRLYRAGSSSRSTPISGIRVALASVFPTHKSQAFALSSDSEKTDPPDGDIAGRVVQIGARMGGAGADPTDSN